MYIYILFCLCVLTFFFFFFFFSDSSQRSFSAVDLPTFSLEDDGGGASNGGEGEEGGGGKGFRKGHRRKISEGKKSFGRFLTHWGDEEKGGERTPEEDREREKERERKTTKPKRQRRNTADIGTMKKISRHDTSPRDSSPLRFNRDGNHQYATVCDSVHRDVTHRDVLNRDSVHHDGTKSDVTFMKFDPPNYHQPQNITKFDSGGCTAIHVDVTSQYREAILKRDISPRKKHENSPKKLRRKREKTRRSVSPGPSSSSSPSPSPSPSSSSCCCCSSSFYPAPFLPSGSLPSILSTASPCPSPPYQSSSCGPLSPKSPHHRHRSPARFSFSLFLFFRSLSSEMLLSLTFFLSFFFFHRANQSPPPNLASLAEGLINLKVFCWCCVLLVYCMLLIV